MVRMLSGYIPTRVIYVAAKLELTDHIGDDGASAQDVAQKLKVDPAALYRVMRVSQASACCARMSMTGST